MYFITAKNSETGNKFQIISDKANAALLEGKALAKEIGFIKWRPGYWSVYGGFSALIFNEKPDLKNFKEVGRNEYMPKLNTKIGKEIHEKLNAATKVTTKELNDCIGFNGEPIRCIGFNPNNEIYFGFSIKDDWDIKIPKDCKEVTFSEYKELFKK